MLNDAREVLGAALKLKGYSMNDTDPVHWAEAKAMVSAIKPLSLIHISEPTRPY